MSRHVLSVAGVVLVLAVAGCGPQWIGPNQRVCGAFEQPPTPVTAVADGGGPALSLLTHHRVTLEPVTGGNGGQVRAGSQWFHGGTVLAVATSAEVLLTATNPDGGTVTEPYPGQSGCSQGGQWWEFPISSRELILQVGPTSEESLSVVAEVYDLMEVTQ